jgi:uncharacterized membrane protein
MRLKMLSGVMLGFALGGFFDGILLHQILQWHHLLSLVADAGDLRMQILWDGVFHALMYVVAMLALAGLWRSRTPPSGDHAPLTALMLAGFAGWHFVDAVASHWILGIHRIKIDSPNPLAWDLAWLAAFGLVPLAAALAIWKRRRGRAGAAIGPGASFAIAASLSTAMAVWSLQPATDRPLTTVVFAPGTRASAVIDAIRSNNAKLVWADHRMNVVILSVAPRRAWHFYGSGALMVTGAGLPGGCASWSRV